MANDDVMQRLNDQIAWYDRRSKINQRTYHSLKIFVIVVSAMIPLLSTTLNSSSSISPPGWLLGLLGALIAISEGIQQIFQCHANWISFRTTCESLKHEKYLYIGGAGPYRAAAEIERQSLLAERVESLVSQETTNWASLGSSATASSKDNRKAI